jgi:hypothetical protein
MPNSRDAFELKPAAHWSSFKRFFDDSVVHDLHKERVDAGCWCTGR